MTKKIISIPSLGDSSEVEVIEICVKPGDSIGPEDPIIVLESDKAAMELPANQAGVVTSILVNLGDGVSEGMKFVELDVEDDAQEASAKAETELSQAQDNEKVDESNPPTNEPFKGNKTRILNVPVPNLGESSEVEIIEVCIKEGDILEADAPLVVLESDKAAMEVPSPMAGTVLKIHKQIGDHVSEGTLIIDLEVEGEPLEVSDETITMNNDHENVTNSPKEALAPQYASVTSGKVYAGPAVRKLAREFGIDLVKVNPSGPKGRIIKEDLHHFVRQMLNESSAESNEFKFASYEIDFGKWGNVKNEPLTKFQKAALKNLHTSWINIPHVTQHDEADITNLLHLRNRLQKKRYVKISPLAFFVKAISNTLLNFPLLNSSLNGDLDSIVIKDYINIGIAVDTSYGLIVPSIKDVHNLGIIDIAEEIIRLADLAKARKLTASELQGGSFSVSSLGGIGGKFFTPIINPPEVGILGISKTFEKLCLINQQPESRTYLPLSLSYDHRVINGAYAASFIAALTKSLSYTDWIEENMDHG